MSLCYQFSRAKERRKVIYDVLTTRCLTNLLGVKNVGPERSSYSGGVVSRAIQRCYLVPTF